MPFSGQQVRRLQAAILKTFTYDELRQALSVRLEWNLAALVPHGVAYQNQVFHLIEHALRNDALLPLLAALVVERPKHDELAELYAAAQQQEPGATKQGPFRIPFRQNPSFVGREQDLAALHAALAAKSAVGISPALSSSAAGLTGMGGIGKTQLAVEYCYRYADHYPGGVFWINAAAGWRTEFADLGEYLQPELAGELEAHRIAAAADYLKAHPGSLLVLDNVDDPAELEHPLVADLRITDLPCRLLLTTRRRDLPIKWQAVAVSVLPPGPAMQLLLRGPNRQPVLDPAHPEHAVAQEICAILGWLPLALEIAGAHLDPPRQGVRQQRLAQRPLAAYRHELLGRGALPVVDDERGGVWADDLGTRHAAAVAATLAEQWAALANDDARLLLSVAGQLGEAEAIPAPRLGLLAGVADEGGFFGSPFDTALDELYSLSLVEDLRGDQLRLHPLVHAFAYQQTPAAKAAALRQACAGRLLAAYTDVAVIERHCATRGVLEIERDLHTARQLLEGPDQQDSLSRGLHRLLRMVQHESHTLRKWQPQEQPAFFLQQWRKRALLAQQDGIAQAASRRLAESSQPYLELRWTTAAEEQGLERTLSGHSDPVRAVVVTADGRRAVSAADDNLVKVWDLQSGQELYTLRGHSEPVRAVAVTSDGQRAVSASDDHTLKVWNLQNGQELHTLRGHAGEVCAVAVTADGQRAVSASDDQTLKVWNLQNGQELHTLSGHWGKVRAVVVTADGRRAISASDDQTLKVWELQSGQELHTLSGHAGLVRAVAVTADGRRAVSASWDHTLKVWNLQSGQELHTLSGHAGEVRAVAVTADGRRAVSASDDSTLKVWNLQNGQELHSLRRHSGTVTSVALTVDGRQAVSASDDSTLRIWDLQNGQELHTLSGHFSFVTAVAVTADGRRAVSASDDRTLKIWDLQSGEQARTRSGHAGIVFIVGLTADSRRAISGSDDETLKVWDLQSGQEVHTLSGHTGMLYDLVVTANGQVVSAAEDNTLKVWDLQSGKPLHTLTGHFGSVKAVAVTANEERAVSASYDNTLRVWDLHSGKQLHTLHGHTDKVLAVAVTADGWQAVSASVDSTLKVWDLQSGQELHTLRGHTDRVTAVKLTTDSRRAVSASSDNTLRLWDLQEGRELRTLRGHSDQVTAVILTAHDRRAVSASFDTTLRLWDLESGESLHILRGHFNWVLALAVTSDGQRAVSASIDNTIRVWNLQEASCLGGIELDAPPVSMALAADDATLFVGDGAGNLHCLHYWEP